MTAFKATFADMKLVKTRQVAQLIFEIPLSDFDAAYEVLGGMPNPSAERWFGIAAIDVSKLDKPKREWRDMSPAQQAGIRCQEAIFAAFLKENHPDDWHESGETAACVRLICGVSSRAYIEKDQRSRMIWHQLDSEFTAWKALERA